MNYAKEIACDVLYRTNDPKYDEDIRQYQGCPTLAVTRGGRIYLELKKRGILVRHFDRPTIAAYNRITVGTDAEMQTLIDTLADIVGKSE